MGRGDGEKTSRVAADIKKKKTKVNRICIDVNSMNPIKFSDAFIISFQIKCYLYAHVVHCIYYVLWWRRRWSGTHSVCSNLTCHAAWLNADGKIFIYYGVCVLMSPEIRDMDNKDIQMIPVIMCGLWMRFCLQSCDSSRSVSLFKYKLASLFMRRPATVWLPEIYVSVRVFRGQLAGVSFSPKDDEHIWQKTYGFGCTVMFWLYLSSHIGRRGISKFP